MIMNDIYKKSAAPGNLNPSAVLVDDEVKRFQLQNAEQAGYEFEMGRQRALKELKEEAEMMETIGPLY